MQAINNAIIN